MSICLAIRNVLYHMQVLLKQNAKKRYLRRMNRNSNINKARSQINQLLRVSI